MRERNGYYGDPYEKREDEHYVAMDWATRGMYEWLRDQCWIRGSIPADPEQLEQMLQGIGPLNFRSVWAKLRKCFKPIMIDEEARLICPCVEVERKRRDEFKQKSAFAGHKSGEVRRERAKKKPVRAQAESFPQVQVVIKPITSNQPSTNLEPGTSNKELVTRNQEPASLSCASSESPTSSVLKQPRQDERTKADDIQKFWAPVEGHLRKNMVHESFQEYYAGCQLKALRHDEVVLAVPVALIVRYGNAHALSEVMSVEIENSQTGLLRGRPLRIVPLDGDSPPG